MPRPDWVNVRSDLSSQGAGYIMLDKTNLASAASTGDVAWTYPTLTTGLTSVSANPVRYRKDSAGTVHIAGAIEKTSGAIFSGTMFTVNVGWRAGGNSTGAGLSSTHPYFLARKIDSASTVTSARVYTGSNGAIRLDDTLSTGDFIELSHISYFAEN